MAVPVWRDLLACVSRPRRREWSIGIYEGASPLSLSPCKSASNPVLQSRDVIDVQAAFVADPFMIRADDGWVMFFEVFNRRTGKGEIGCAKSANGIAWCYGGIVLAEPFHLSYPYVFRWQDTYYMMPESSAGTAALCLYAARSFPSNWELAATLLQNGCYVDASLVRYEDRWWLFAETNAPRNDTLRLYHSDDLMGPWMEHAKRPLLSGNPHFSRPAGRAIVYRNRIIRFAQDCWPRYGRQIHAFEITQLSREVYCERPAGPTPLIGPGRSEWNSSGMHHVDPHQIEAGRWLACVDGSAERCPP
jgi:hypothetical protein